MTALERRCRLLLRAYPAGYRRDRGAEIVGTLLEATPAGRSWPLPRDVRSLVAGGLRARAALNQQQTTAANLRTAALIGATAYLALGAVADLSFAVSELTAPIRSPFAVWPPLLAGALILAAVAVAWISSRRVMVLTGAIAAGAGVAVSLTPGWPRVVGAIIVEFPCVAVLALQAARDVRPARGWLWPVTLVAASPLLNYLMPGVWITFFLWLLAALGVVSLLWVVIDARPAVAMSVFVLAFWLPAEIAGMLVGPDISALVSLLFVVPLAAVAVWLLRHQSARVTERRES